MSEEIENKVALVIIAHPDDAEFGAAGTVAAWVKEGWQVYYVIVADGSGGGPDEATDVGPEARRKVAETRKGEQRSAGEILGLKDVIFLDYPDGQIQPNNDLRRDLVRLLRKYKPYRVVCQSPDRTWTPFFSMGRHHPDHLATGQATLAAVYPCSQNPWDFPELLDEGYLPHKVKEVYIMGAPTNNSAVDITNTIEQKIAALRAHVSQVSANFEETEKRVRAWAADNGKKYELEYAEVFHKVDNP